MSDEKKQVEKFISSYTTEVEEKYWKTVPFDTTGGRASKSPIMDFYETAMKMCENGLKHCLQNTTSSAGAGSFIAPDKELMKIFLNILKDAEAGKKPWQDTIKDVKQNKQVELDNIKTKLEEKIDPKEKLELENKLSGLNLLIGKYNSILKSHRIMEMCEMADAETMDGHRQDLFAQLSYDFVRAQPISLVARDLLNPLNVRIDSAPQPNDWSWLHETMTRVTDEDGFSWCALVHTYWMDESGLAFCLERLTDRVENGINASTRHLMSVRVAETGMLPNVLSKYAYIWQQGDLAAVDERRRQYLATYGFPLHVATRWGQMETVDPNRAFPEAFHGFLVAALHFYRDSRNIQMVPDVQSAMKAFIHMGRILRERDENLRRVRPAELRGQMEYVKQVLGGTKDHTVGTLKENWQAALPGRPGVMESMDPWEYAVDTVAELYRWQRPSVREYRSLAENGEILMIITRIFSAPSVTDFTEARMWALLDVLRERIRQYAASYKVVSGVDLAAPNPYLGAPALAMAKHIPAPPLPPLRRNWATELPAA